MIVNNRLLLKIFPRKEKATMQTNEIQELLLDTIPAWHYWFARPFKRMLNDGVSLDMYYCIQSMRRSGHTMTMTELANFARMPKQVAQRL